MTVYGRSLGFLVSARYWKAIVKVLLFTSAYGLCIGYYIPPVIDFMVANSVGMIGQVGFVLGIQIPIFEYVFWNMRRLDGEDMSVGG